MVLLVVVLKISGMPENGEITGVGGPPASCKGAPEGLWKQSSKCVPVPVPGHTHICVHRKALDLRLVSCHYNCEKSPAVTNNRTVQSLQGCHLRSLLPGKKNRTCVLS